MNIDIKTLLIVAVITLAAGCYAGYHFTNQHWIAKQESTSLLEEESRDNTLCEMTLVKLSSGDDAGKTRAIVGGNDKTNCLDTYIAQDRFPANTEVIWLW